MAILINGNGNPAIYAAQDADLIASLAGNTTGIAKVGNEFAYTAEDANTISVADGVIVTKEGRRIQLDAGENDTFTIPAGTAGVTNYYIIGYQLHENASGQQIADTFVQLMANATDTIQEDTFRGGASDVYVSLYRVEQDGVNLGTITLLLPKLTNISQVNDDLDDKAHGLYNTIVNQPDIGWNDGTDPKIIGNSTNGISVRFDGTNFIAYGKLNNNTVVSQTLVPSVNAKLTTPSIEQNTTLAFPYGGAMGFFIKNPGDNTLRFYDHDNVHLANLNSSGTFTAVDFYFRDSQKYLSSLIKETWSTVTINDNTFTLRDSNPMSNKVVRFGNLVVVSLTLYKDSSSTYNVWTTLFTLPYNVNSAYFVPIDVVATQSNIQLLASGKTLSYTGTLGSGLYYANFSYFTSDPQ